MEWLQTYKIGDELLKTGKYKQSDAYLGEYHPPMNKSTKQKKTPYILELILDLNKVSVGFELRNFGEDTLNDGLINDVISKEYYFTSVAGNFASYYLCNKYGNQSNVLDFFGIENGKVIDEKKGFLTEVDNLIREDLIDSSIYQSRFIKVREIIRKDTQLVCLLDIAISKLDLFIDSAKIKTFDKDLTNLGNIPIPLNPRIDLSSNSNHDIALIVIKIQDNSESYYLNREKELVDFYSNRFLSLARISCNNMKKGTCFFNKSEDVYNVSMPRDDVNILKMFTNSLTTLSNLSGDNLNLSQEAYEKLKLGAWFISKKLRVTIAGVRHYIIPDFNSKFEILRYKAELSEKIEIAFNRKEYQRMKERFYRLSNKNINSISFLGYWSDGRQIDFTNRIQIVNPDHFNFVFDTFEEQRDCISEIADINKKSYSYFTLASSYLLFPVSTNTPKKNSSLDFYKMLLEKIPIPDMFLIENFIKLTNIYRYGKKDERTSRFIGTVNVPYSDPKYFDTSVSIAVIKYLILLSLTNKIYNKQHIMEMETEINKRGKTENFFKLSGFSSSDSKKSLFYLGRLIKRVAKAQEDYGNSKAILNKINYSGMSVSDIQWLSIEVVEKLKQYNRGNYPALDLGEKDLGLFNEHFCLANSQGQDSWDLTDIENVFYLFVGYGMYWQTMDSKEKSIIGETSAEILGIQNEDVNEEENNED